MVLINAPVNSPSEVEPTVKAGASEVYCGLIDGEWDRKYSAVCAPNRREWRESNLKSFRELAQVVGKAHALDVPVSLAVNAPYFSGSQEKDLLRYVKKAHSTGVDNLMVADIGTLLRLSELGLDVDVSLSSVAGAYNSQAISFYRGLGVERAILPRHLCLSEIHSILKSHPDFKFEVFILFNRCLFSDGLCTFLHGSKEYGLGRNVCGRRFKVKEMPGGRENTLFEEVFHSPESAPQNFSFQCGMCALYDLSRWGVYGVKVVGRGKPFWMREFGVRMLKKIIDHLEEKPSKVIFMRDVRSIVENTVFADSKRPCNQFNCFFPELI